LNDNGNIFGVLVVYASTDCIKGIVFWQSLTNIQHS